MTVSRNTGGKKPATQKGKSPARKRSTSTTIRSATRASADSSAASVPTGARTKPASKKPAPIDKAVEAGKTDTDDSRTSASPKVANDEKQPVSPTAAPIPEPQKLSAPDPVRDSTAGNGHMNGRHVSTTILSSTALVVGVLSMLAAGYAVYITQFDSRLERMRQHDQIEFLQQRAEAILEIQSTLETSVTDLRLSSAELEAANRERLGELRRQIADQEDSIRQLSAESLEELLGQIEALEEELKSLSREVARTETYFQGGVESWTLKEIEHLLLVADYQLRFTGENHLALDALEIAFTRLHALGNPDYSEVRRLLAQDIQTLKSSASVESLSLLEKLRVLNDRVPYLPVLGDLATSESSIGTEAGSPKITGPGTDQQSEGVFQPLVDAGARFLNSFADLIQVEKNNRPVRPLMSGEIRQLIYERTHLSIESAESALIRQQPVLVAERLSILRSWVFEHFDTDSGITIEWVGMLDDILEQLPEDPPGDLSKSIAVLQAVMES